MKKIKMRNRSIRFSIDSLRIAKKMNLDISEICRKAIDDIIELEKCKKETIK